MGEERGGEGREREEGREYSDSKSVKMRLSLDSHSMLRDGCTQGVITTYKMKIIPKIKHFE
jgi:hypothetical protein